jgi:hypothetical protein
MIISTGLVIYAVLLLVIAFCAYAVISEPPSNDGPLGDLYPLQPYLHHAKVVLISVVFAGLVARAGRRNSMLDPESFLHIQSAGRIVLALSAIVFLILLAHAGLKLWRDSKAGA